MLRADCSNPLYPQQYEIGSASCQNELREGDARDGRGPQAKRLIGPSFAHIAAIRHPPLCSGDRDALSNSFRPTTVFAIEPERLSCGVPIRRDDADYIERLAQDFRSLKVVTTEQGNAWTTRLLSVSGEIAPARLCSLSEPPNAEHLRACRAYVRLVTLCAVDLDREQREVLHEALCALRPPCDRYPNDGFTEDDATSLADSFRQYRDEYRRMLSALDDPISIRLPNADLLAVYAREDMRTREAYEYIAASDRDPTPSLIAAQKTLRHVREIYRRGNKSGNKRCLSRRLSLEYLRFSQTESHVVAREADMERRLNTDYAPASAHNCLELTTMACRKALADGWCVAYVTTGAHSFAVLGGESKDAFDQQVRVWSGKLEDAPNNWVICDPWCNLVCPVGHYRALFGAKMQRWEYQKQLRHPFGGWVASKKLDALFIGGTATAYSFEAADNRYLLAADNTPRVIPEAFARR